RHRLGDVHELGVGVDRHGRARRERGVHLLGRDAAGRARRDARVTRVVERLGELGLFGGLGRSAARRVGDRLPRGHDVGDLLRALALEGLELARHPGDGGQVVDLLARALPGGSGRPQVHVQRGALRLQCGDLGGLRRRVVRLGAHVLPPTGHPRLAARRVLSFRPFGASSSSSTASASASASASSSSSPSSTGISPSWSPGTPLALASSAISWGTSPPSMPTSLGDSMVASPQLGQTSPASRPCCPLGSDGSLLVIGAWVSAEKPHAGQNRSATPSSACPGKPCITGSWPSGSLGSVPSWPGIGWPSGPTWACWPISSLRSSICRATPVSGSVNMLGGWRKLHTWQRSPSKASTSPHTGQLSARRVSTSCGALVSP